MSPGLGSVSRRWRIAIDEPLTAYKTKGKKKEEDRFWGRHGDADGVANCTFCDTPIVRERYEEEQPHEAGQIHHLIKQYQFPRYSHPGIDDSGKEYKSRHHPLNTVAVCTSCHGTWEDWAQGRPHLWSWLCKGIKRQEMPLKLVAPDHLTEDQDQSWVRARWRAQDQGDGTCAVCSRERTQVTKPVLQDDTVAFRYTGPDVRAVHVISPEYMPMLMHRQENLVLLCWDCLFAGSAQAISEPGSTPDATGWRTEPPAVWGQRFAPKLYSQYDDELPRRGRSR